MNREKLLEARELLDSDGWDSQGPSTKHLRDVLDLLIEALSEEK